MASSVGLIPWNARFRFQSERARRDFGTPDGWRSVELGYDRDEGARQVWWHVLQTDEPADSDGIELQFRWAIHYNREIAYVERAT